MQIEQYLDKLGLSQYEKQAYITLLQIGRTKSKTLAKESSVSYGRIYEILDKLQQKSLISTFPTIPKTFEAIEPQTAFELHLNKRMAEIEELQKHIPEIEVPAKRYLEEDTNKTIIIHGKQKQMQLITQLNEKAQEELLSIPGVFEPPPAVLRTGLRALQRGVKVKRLLRQITEKNRDIVKQHIELGEEVRQSELPGLRLKVVDRKEAALVIVDPKTKNRMTLHTTNEAFANSMAIFFESLWEDSKSVQEKIYNRRKK